ncbi:hypothetical protein [Marinomonas transparens]|uniref:Uncharacterized protein n=1 Tax=Marinomonas transparens TaxID=2795388 RepID=A0A934MY06_9GAMM|nr:hypothetical protein [Marinomonas transparens]MBJ7539889.1 hypothetical protein [Marinomonas transparens]
MQEITNQVSESLILLWSHERGEMSIKQIDAAATQPDWTIVNKEGAAIDITVAEYDGSDAYGIHAGNGKVYWANSVFNSLYIAWPETITPPVKALITAQLEKAFIVIKEGS